MNILPNFLSVMVLLSIMSGSVTAQSSAKPAPRLYVTHRFGLVMRVPSGLSFCPLRDSWSGSEEGTVLFLKPPLTCLAPGHSSATRPIDGFVPSITLRYHVNRSREDAYDGTIPKPRTSEEFAEQFCAGPFESPDFKLFGQQAFTCRSDLPGNRIQIVLMAVYDSARSRLVLTLLTTPDRLTDDTQTLATLASSVAHCHASSGKDKHEAAACPKGNWW